MSRIVDQSADSTSTWSSSVKISAAALARWVDLGGQIRASSRTPLRGQAADTGAGAELGEYAGPRRGERGEESSRLVAAERHVAVRRDTSKARETTSGSSALMTHSLKRA